VSDTSVFILLLSIAARSLVALFGKQGGRID
jgi:hypothetical protein